jgi:hypothetical protein
VCCVVRLLLLFMVFDIVLASLSESMHQRRAYHSLILSLAIITP